jgi:hypothetical protein
MTSAIVSSTIDADYPVAGQDNDSQGFRDNFSVIKDGLATANAEITVLQNTSAKLDADNDFGGNLIDNAITNRLYGSVYSTTSTATTNVSLTNGEYHEITIAGSHLLTFQDWPSTGLYGKIKVSIKSNGVNYNFSFATGGGGTIRFMGSLTNPIATGTDPNASRIFEIWTINAGVDVYVVEMATAGVSPTTINDLLDVTVSGSASGQVLSFNGTSWVNGDINLSLNNLSNVSIVTPSSGQILKYIGGQWINSSDLTASVTGGAGAGVATGGTTGQILTKVSNTDFDTTWVDKIPDTNTTYAIKASTTTGGANLDLDAGGSGIGTDSVKFAGGYGTTVTRSDANTITINSNNFKEYVVTIADDGSDIQEIFFIDGNKITSAGLKFVPGFTYKFNLSDPSNAVGPLRFSTTPDTAVPATVNLYSTGVTVVGSAGSVGAYIQIVITTETPNLYVYGNETDPMTDTSKFGGETQIPVGGTETKLLVRKNYTAMPNQRIVGDSSGGPFTITLPTNVVAGDFVSFADNGHASTNFITIAAGAGIKIDGVATNLTCASNFSAITLVSDGSNWIIQNILDVLDAQDLLGSNGIVDPRAEIIYFSTAGAETATLQTSGNGRTIQFAMVADGGDMVITVTNPAWNSGSTGTMTFNAVGQGCTMTYISNKWVCVGNNGVTFA